MESPIQNVILCVELEIFVNLIEEEHFTAQRGRCVTPRVLTLQLLDVLYKKLICLLKLQL